MEIQIGEWVFCDTMGMLRRSTGRNQILMIFIEAIYSFAMNLRK